jgi:phage terminase large subunit-like protein
VPRQNGKNGIIEVRELYGMAVLGEKFLHTAHEVKTARKAFLRIASFFENERQYPELARLVADVRKTNGQEAVILTNGGSVEFIARSRGSGRGFTVDVLVCDEAQELGDEELAALLPTISAAPSGNPQVIVTGTPPDPERPEMGSVFRRMRADGEAGRDARLSWTDYGAGDGPLPDVDDRAAWVRHNPAEGLRLSMAEIERERALMSPETFARERMGWWGDPLGSAGVISGWHECFVDEAPPPLAAVGLAASIGGEHGSIASADLWMDGRVNLSSVDRRPGTSWLVAEAKRIQDTYGCPVAMDEKCPDATLLPALRDAGVIVTIVSLPEYVEACSELVKRVAERTLTHQRTTELEAAVAGAKWRSVGDGRRVFGRVKSTVPIDMLEAATFAMREALLNNYDVNDSIG